MTAKPVQMTLMLFGAPDATPTLGSVTVSERTNLPTRMDGLMSLRAACLASLRLSSGSGVDLLTSVGSGPTRCESLASYSRDTASWKTRQQSLLSTVEEHSWEYSERLPKSGMMCNGTLYPLLPLVQGIDGTARGYWLPTPIARDWKDTPGMARRSGSRKRTDTLPRAIYDREQSPARSGIVNPELSLWLMGYPDGWLEIS